MLSHYLGHDVLVAAVALEELVRRLELHVGKELRAVLGVRGKVLGEERLKVFFWALRNPDLELLELLLEAGDLQWLSSWGSNIDPQQPIYVLIEVKGR